MLCMQYKVEQDSKAGVKRTQKCEILFKQWQ